MSDQTAGAGVQHRVLVVQLLRNVVSVQNRVLRRVLQTLSTSHRNVHPANRQNTGRTEERLRNRQSSIVGELTLRVSTVCVTRQELRQVLTNSQRANTGAATTVRNGEGLVQVQVRNVAAELTRLSEAHLSVQVCTIQVHLATRLVNQLANLSNLLFKHTVSGGVGNHDAGNLGTVLLDLCLQVININRTISSGCHTGNLQTSQSSRCRVGAVRRQRNQDGIALVVAVSLVEGTDSAQAGVLTGRTRVRLQGHCIVTGNSNQPIAQVLNQLVPALSLILRDQRVNVRELRPGDGLHLSSCVQLHGARAQRNHGAVKCQVLIGEVTQVAHHLGLGAVLVENRVLHVVIGTQQLSGQIVLCVCLTQGAAQSLNQALQQLLTVRLTHGNTNAVLIEAADVHASFQSLRNQLIGAAGSFHHDGVEESIVSDTVTRSLQRGSNTSSIGVQAVRDSAQALRTVVHRVSASNNSQQSLSSTNIGSSLLAADVLLTSLQSQTVRRLTGRVRRNTHQAARHGAFHTLVNSHVRSVRATEEEGQTETLSVAHSDVCTQLTRRLQQGQSQQVSDHSDQSVTLLSGLNQRLNIANIAFITGVRQDDTVQVALGQALREVSNDEGNAEHLCTAASHRNNLRQATGVNREEAILHLAVCTVHHDSCFSYCGCLIQQGGVCNLQAGQLHHGVLEVQQSLQTALRNLSLVRGVRSVETGVFQNVTAQNSGSYSIVVSGTNHLGKNLILRSVAGNLCLSLMLRQRSGQLQLAVKANLGGNDSVHQRIQGRVSQGFEHLLCVCGTGAEMTINKGHRVLLLVGANRRGVTSRYCDESNTLSVPHLHKVSLALPTFDMPKHQALLPHQSPPPLDENSRKAQSPARPLLRENEPDSVKANFTYTPQKDVLEDPT